MVRAIVLAHFDVDGIVDDYVIDALRRYRQVAEHVVMVSASVTGMPSQLTGLVDQFVARKNVGYDFGSWRAGIDALGSRSGIDELICVNDSVYGPFQDLRPVLGDSRVAHADVWGMCLSVQGTEARGHVPTEHLQSWFVAIRGDALKSEAFRQFWESVGSASSKADVINRHEIGLSQCLQAAGFRLAAIHDSRTARPPSVRELLPMASWSRPCRSLRMIRRGMRGAHRFNPAELRPVRLMRDGVPFIKSSVFRVNHYRLNLRAVERAVEAIGGYDVGLVRRHQLRLRKRALRGRSASAPSSQGE
jgi:lipopolysaccharide biosynthesis protein